MVLFTFQVEPEPILQSLTINFHEPPTLGFHRIDELALNRWICSSKNFPRKGKNFPRKGYILNPYAMPMAGYKQQAGWPGVLVQTLNGRTGTTLYFKP